jgi:hypothetical protein
MFGAFGGDEGARTKVNIKLHERNFLSFYILVPRISSGRCNQPFERCHSAERLVAQMRIGLYHLFKVRFDDCIAFGGFDCGWLKMICWLHY